MKSDIVLSEGNSILNIKLKFSFYWKMLLFLRKLNYQIILWKKHYQTREIEKRFCFLWKQFYWKEILSLAGEHSGKPPSSCFSFTLLIFLYENSTWLISRLSLDHLIKNFGGFLLHYLKLFENSGMIFLALLGLNIQKYCQHFVRWSNLSKRLGGNKILNWFFLFRFIPQDGVSGQIISKTWFSIV